MAKKTTLKKCAELMKDLDLCMLTTTTAREMTASRPMSNNKDVDFDGNSYFFTNQKTQLVKDIKKNPNVNLSFIGSKRLQKLFISLSGIAKLIQDKEAMEPHWTKDLEIWFKDGLDTPGITMIEVKAKQVRYWHGSEEGSIAL